MSAITHVRHVSFAVPDLKESREFYEHHWNLDVAHDEGGRSWLAAGGPEPYVVRLRADDEPGVDVIGFGLPDRAAVDAEAQRLIAAGVELVSEPAAIDAPGGGYGFRIFDPDGRLLELSAAVEDRAYRPVEPGEPRPLRVNHVVLNTVDVDRLRRWYETALGFRVSDWLAEFMCFLRCTADHHTVAIAAAPHASLNHVAFEMRGVDEFMRGVGRFVRRGIHPIWGPGRHGPGNNTFGYFVDPHGNVVEYTTELLQVDESTWKPSVWSPEPEQADLWGTAGPLGEEARAAMTNRPDPGLWQVPPQ